ncbi:MAG: amino acid permease [Candidatus Marinimicrobia bacterium]|nr:amino acid permease [Candidatus Neomarinimicrobiota bacterium]
MALKKDLGSLEVFCVAAGAMVSSGLFVLPAVVYSKVGPAIILSYLFGSFLMIPAIISKVELATAMPKSGGTYFFVHRSLGALLGTFAGYASWFSLSLKSAFALIGIGLFLQPLLPSSDPVFVKYIAIGFTLFFTLINIVGIKESGRFQVLMVFALLGILVVFIAGNITKIHINHYVPFTPYGWKAVFTVTGLIFISYGGLTKVASIAEEIRNPTKNIYIGMVSAYLVISVVYLLVISITVGLLTHDEMSATLNPISRSASEYYGPAGYWVLSIAAMLAFITTGNAGLMASSRIPLAMAEDHLIPATLGKVSIKFHTPVYSILVTSSFMIISILFLNLENLVKVASTMMLILFFLVNLSVILMRESKIGTYRPSYKSNLYPFVQIAGLFIYIFLIIEMGALPLFITLFFFTISLVWYFFYSKSRNEKQSALLHIVQNVVSKKIVTPTLTNELRDILMQRDNIVVDKFDEIINQANIIELEEGMTREAFFQDLSIQISKKFQIDRQCVFDRFQAREDKFSTAIYDGLAIPHIIVEGEQLFDIVIARSRAGIIFDEKKPPAHVIFALLGSEDQRTFHLRALMSIAQIIQNKNFIENWKKAKSKEDLRNLILLAERVRKGTL